MTEAEAVALRWVSTHLHLLECDRCGGRWIAARSTPTVFHRCAVRRRGVDWRTPRQRHDDDRAEWARGVLGPIAESIEDALGDRALLPVEEEE